MSSDQVLAVFAPAVGAGGLWYQERPPSTLRLSRSVR